MTASDPAQPASSRATATAAMVFLLWRAWKGSPPRSHRLPSGPRIREAAGPAASGFGVFGRDSGSFAVLPGGLNQQPGAWPLPALVIEPSQRDSPKTAHWAPAPRRRQSRSR